MMCNLTGILCDEEWCHLYVEMHVFECQGHFFFVGRHILLFIYSLVLLSFSVGKLLVYPSRVFMHIAHIGSKVQPVILVKYCYKDCSKYVHLGKFQKCSCIEMW